MLLLEQHLGATQRNDSRPAIALAGNVLGQFVEAFLSGDEVVGAVGDFGKPEFGGQRQLALGETRRSGASAAARRRPNVFADGHLSLQIQGVLQHRRRAFAVQQRL